MASGNFTTSNTSNRTEHRGGYEQAPTASALPTISSQNEYQDAPPTYDEAVLGYDKTFNGDDKLQDQNELPFKGDYNPQLDPGPPPLYQPNSATSSAGLPPTIPVQNVEVVFEKRPVKALCQNCSSYDYTRVEDKINSEGWLWCILCCFCGIWLLSFLVKCMDGFREFNHYCQRCGNRMANYKPRFNSASVALLLVLSLLSIFVVVFIYYFRMLRKEVHDTTHYA